MKKKLLKSQGAMFLSVLVCSTLLFPNAVKSDVTSEFQIYPETQAAIDAAVSQKLANQEYMDSVVALFNNDIHTTSDDLNDLLMESLEKTSTVLEKTNQELEEANVKAQKEAQEAQMTLLNEYPGINTRAASWYGDYDNYDGIDMNFMNGIGAVELAGAPNTAEYMRHAWQPNPTTFISNNDEWAASCVFNDSLFAEIEVKFQREILATGKSYGVVTGDFEYTTANSDLDHRVGLQNVRFSVTFVKKSNGYSATHLISDIYDFDWMGYDNIVIGFGNNYCKMMQDLGRIHPYNIQIIYNL